MIFYKVQDKYSLDKKSISITLKLNMDQNKG
jgi:hypothetical protein